MGMSHASGNIQLILMIVSSYYTTPIGKDPTKDALVMVSACLLVCGNIKNVQTMFTRSTHHFLFTYFTLSRSRALLYAG